MATKDYYGTLGVEKSAGADEIKSAYRRLAKKYHPDMYSQKPEAERKSAEAKFKEIQHAYDVLSDPQKKAAFDRYGDEQGPQMGGGGGNPFSGFSSGGFSSSGGFGGFEDIFSDLFSGFGGSRPQQRNTADRNGDDLEMVLNLSFKEACFGVEKEVTFKRVEKCKSCNGTGAKNGTAYSVCPKCGGTGRINVTQRTMLGVMQTQQVCDMCHGTGKKIDTPCPDCGGNGSVKATRTLKIKVPAGIENGQMITMRGEGGAGRGQGANGNLIVVVQVASHPVFKREGANLFVDYPVTFMQAVLGGKIEVPTLLGTSVVDLPAGVQSGTVIRVKGKGVKYLRKDAYGDLYIKILVEIPKNLTSKQRKKLEAMVEAMEGVKFDQVEKFKKQMRSL